MAKFQTPEKQAAHGVSRLWGRSRGDHPARPTRPLDDCNLCLAKCPDTFWGQQKLEIFIWPKTSGGDAGCCGKVLCLLRFGGISLCGVSLSKCITRSQRLPLAVNSVKLCHLDSPFRSREIHVEILHTANPQVSCNIIDAAATAWAQINQASRLDACPENESLRCYLVNLLFANGPLANHLMLNGCKVNLPQIQFLNLTIVHRVKIQYSVF